MGAVPRGGLTVLALGGVFVKKPKIRFKKNRVSPALQRFLTPGALLGLDPLLGIFLP